MALRAEILSLDLAPISFITAVEYGWSLDKVDAVELEYRAFLHAVLDHPDRAVAPSRDCDRYWHMHVLDTRRYADDCLRIFGRFIHHFPYAGIRGRHDRRQQLRRYHWSQQVIGQLMTELRNRAFTHPEEVHHEAVEVQ